jgi:hypothetical protein
VLHTLVSKSDNWNKSKNSSKERIDLLQNQWNNLFKKHVDVDHYFIAQFFEEIMNSLLKSTKEIQTSKKRTNPFRGSIFKFFFVKYTLKKEDVLHKEFLKDLG